MTTRLIRSLPFVTSFCSLIACSGGDSGEQPAINRAPQIVSAPVVQAAENIKTPILKVRTQDGDGDLVTLELLGEDAQWFALAADGELRFVAPPNYERPLDVNGDNRYEFTVLAQDTAGAQAQQVLAVEVTNVEFAFEFLAPLPNTILELEHYSRLPIGVWVEYDYSERLQIICNGEIMNKASDSGASWTGSISLANGAVPVQIEFWRGDQIIHELVVPVRHQHVISAPQNVVYDSVLNELIIPHDARNEILLVNADTGATRKVYPWVGTQPTLMDAVFDPITATTIYGADKFYRLDITAASAAPLAVNLEDTHLQNSVGRIAYNIAQNTLFAVGREGGSHYVMADLATGSVSAQTYTSSLQHTAAAALAFDEQQTQLFIAPVNAEGVDVIIPGEATPLASIAANWPSAYQRISDLVLDPMRYSLVMANPSSHSLVQLDLNRELFQVVSGRNFLGGGDSDVRGIGPALHAPAGLAMDVEGNRLFTTSAFRLLHVDTESGARNELFNSVAGTGDLSSGFAGIWVALDGAKALAVDKQVGRMFEINLRTGEKTAFSVAAAIPQNRADYQVQRAKISRDGLFAAIHYRKLDASDSSLDLLDLIDLRTRRSIATFLNTAQKTVVDFNFSQPQERLILLTQKGLQAEVEEYSLQDRSLLRAQAITPLAEPHRVLAVHRINNIVYLLEQVAVDTATPYFQLSSLTEASQRASLFTIPDKAAGKTGATGIDVFFDSNLIAVLLPEQPPVFWNIEIGREEAMNIATFHGSDQPKDFYSVDDFREFYYFRANAGLHVCWRFYCSILVN